MSTFFCCERLEGEGPGYSSESFLVADAVCKSSDEVIFVSLAIFIVELQCVHYTAVFRGLPIQQNLNLDQKSSDGFYPGSDP